MHQESDGSNGDFKLPMIQQMFQITVTRAVFPGNSQTQINMLNSPEDASGSRSEWWVTSPSTARLSSESQVPSYDDSDRGSLLSRMANVTTMLMLHDMLVNHAVYISSSTVRKKTFNL